MAGFDKVVNTYEEAMAGLEDGMTVIAGGFGICGIPENLITQMKKMGTKTSLLFPTTVVSMGLVWVSCWKIVKLKR